MILKPHRIDIHHHILPPEYLSTLAKIGITTVTNLPFPKWEPEDSLEIMDRQGIAIAITSISSPGIYFGDLEFSRSLARLCNEYSANLIRKYPERFGSFAALPLPDIDASLLELEYALDILELDGVGMLTNYNGIYIGDPEFTNLFSELDRRRTVVFIHPDAPPSNKLPNLNLPSSVLEFVFDTTRAIANLMHHGIFKKYPNIKFIFAHAGGTAPYLAWRITFGNKRLISQFNDLYYGTALSATSNILHSLIEIVDYSHILFGSDFPFVHEIVVKEMIQELINNNRFDKQTRLAIEQENALLLFPRFRAYL
ncbi:MAG: amidohydrolase family protein [Promethearchaeota archaeon]